MFNKQDTYTRHLEKQHRVSDDQEVQTLIVQNQLGWNGEPHFWCGFCREVVKVWGGGLAAWNQRFNHIDGEHFKKGKRIEEWFFPSGCGGRKRGLGETQSMSDAEENGQDDEQYNESDCISGDDHEGNNNAESEPVCRIHLDDGSTCEGHSTNTMTAYPGQRPSDYTEPEGPGPAPPYIQTEKRPSRKRKLRTTTGCAQQLVSRPSPFSRPKRQN
ncbi:hypothetical protein BDV06DRAFT_94945 [Aspergillus oleicola]